MKRLIALLFLLASPSFATTTVTGTINNLGTGSSGSATFVRFWLRGCGGNQPRVSGAAVIAPSQGGVFYFDIAANSSGAVSGTLYSTRDSTGNSGGEIECGGSTTSEWYGMQIFVNGQGGPETPIQAKNTTTIDISNVTPITTNPVVTAPTGDTTYFRIDGGNSGLKDAAGTITASEPVYCNNLGNVRCIDPTNLAGWSGSDAGAWINSARTDCGTQDCSIKIAPGTYSVSTPITFTHNTALLCPGPATFTGTSFLNWLPATGTMISVSGGVTFMMEGCRLEAPNNTGSVALQLGRVIYKTVVENFRINGFTGGIRVTGDGVSLTSTGVDIENGYISGFCGTGSYAINADHVGDITVDRVQAYSTVDCATSIPLILDTGVGGAWLTDSTFEQGLHAGIIRNTNQGGSYGSAPAAIFPKAITWDTTPGGDTLLFDSTLGISDIRFYCDSCWFAGAGTNTAGSVVTSTAIGANIEGGSDIHFVGGTSRVNASWGFDLNSSGSDFTIDAVNVHANNQGNTAAIGGILVTGNPTSWSILNTHSGNIVETGGHQQYGADISTASNTGYICNNDFASNVINQYKLSPFTTLSTNPNICGTGAGIIPWGPLQIAQNASPVNPSSGFDLLNFDTSDIFGPLTSAGAFTRSKWSGLIATGTATLTGTGACTSLSSQNGGSWDGEVTCTGTTGASTLTITPGTTAPNHWECSGSDVTSGHELALPQSGLSATTCTLKASSVTANDVLSFRAVAH